MSIWAMSIVAVAASGGNTLYTMTNPVGERVASLESEVRIIKAESEQRAALFSDVGEIKADMRWLREAVSEIKQEVKAKP